MQTTHDFEISHLIFMQVFRYTSGQTVFLCPYIVLEENNCCSKITKLTNKINRILACHLR